MREDIGQHGFVPNKQSVTRQNWRTFAVIFGYYTFLTIAFIPQVYVGTINNPSLFPLTQYVLSHILWLSVMLLVVILYKRFPLFQPVRIRNFGIHLLIAVIICLIFVIVYFSLLGFIDGVGFDHLIRISSDNFHFVRYVTDAFRFYMGLLAFTTAIIYYNLYKERELRIQQAELQMLKMQLHPHFFFNTLNAISTLLYRSPEQADRLITQLSDVFRNALRKEITQEVTLEEELEFLQTYLQIHQTLMGKRLQIDWQIEPETLDALIPNLILQPLVENAIRHGLAPRKEGGRITITAGRHNENLVLQVCNNGLGFISENGNDDGKGIGLSNTRARLKSLYHRNYEFSIVEEEIRGVTVKIEIPFREQKT